MSCRSAACEKVKCNKVRLVLDFSARIHIFAIAEGKGRRSKDMLMKKYVLAIAIASGALFGLSAQAAPVSSAVSGVQSQVTGDAVKVYHCRGVERRLGMRRLGPRPVIGAIAAGVRAAGAMAVTGAIAAGVPGIGSSPRISWNGPLPGAVLFRDRCGLSIVKKCIRLCWRWNFGNPPI